MTKVIVEVEAGSAVSFATAHQVLEAAEAATCEAGTPATKADKPAADKKADKPKHDVDAVRQSLKELAALTSKEVAVAILKDHGASSISELAEGKYDSVVAAAQAKVAEGQAVDDDL